MRREMVYKIISKDWRSRYRKSWLREMISKKRIQKGTVRPISAWELNALIEEKMKEMGTCIESEAVEALIEEVKNGKEY
jgi:hypothetical protein